MLYPLEYKLLVSVLFSVGTMHPTAVPLISTLLSRLVMQTRLHKLQKQNSLSAAMPQDRATENRNLWSLITMLVLYSHSEVIQDTYISRNVRLAYFICIKVVIIKRKKKAKRKKIKNKKADSHHYQEAHQNKYNHNSKLNGIIFSQTIFKPSLLFLHFVCLESCTQRVASGLHVIILGIQK